MKYIIGIMALLFTSVAFGQNFSATQTLNQVYGSYSTSCIVNENADNFATTVDANSASGQKTLNVTATTDLVSGHVISINPGGAREEVCVIDTVSAGASVDCVDNLLFTHTLAQADAVELTNRTSMPSGRRYHVQCHNGAGTAVPCECLQGGPTVNADHYNGRWIMSLQETITVLQKNGNEYISCIPATDNSTISVCPLD